MVQHEILKTQEKRTVRSCCIDIGNGTSIEKDYNVTVYKARRFRIFDNKMLIEVISNELISYISQFSLLSYSQITLF